MHFDLVLPMGTLGAATAAIGMVIYGTNGGAFSSNCRMFEESRELVSYRSATGLDTFSFSMSTSRGAVLLVSNASVPGGTEELP